MRLLDLRQKNMTKTQDTAVVILNWNGEKLLREFLPGVVANTNAALGRVVIADNGSTDGSLAYVAEAFGDSVDVVAFDKNYGYAGGYNRALEALKGKYRYAVLLNSDVLPGESWLDPLVAFMDDNEQAGACQPKILSYREPDTFEYAGASGGYIDRNGYPYCRGRLFGTCEKDHGQYDTVADIFWATGAALMIRLDLFLEVGGLDEDFFAHMEEIDLCWRVLLAGHKIYAVPSSVVYHLGGGSLPAANPRKTFLNFRNNLLLLHKNLPDGDRGRKLFERRLLDTIAWAKFMATFDFGNANAILRAHKEFRVMARNYTSHPDVNLLKQRPDARVNLLVAYYLRGKRKFSQLFG